MGVMLLLYEELQEEADAEGLLIKEKRLIGSDGLIYGNKIAIRREMPIVKKGCTLAEEMGHHYITYGDILDQDTIEKQKQEFRSRVWGYQRIITMDKLIAAYNKGCRNSYEIAEELEVTEEFFLEALQVFKQKYYPYIQYKDYLIRFEPDLQIYSFTY